MDKQLQFRISQGDLDAAKRKAHREAVTLAEVMRRLLRAWTRGEIKTPPNGDNAS